MLLVVAGAAKMNVVTKKILFAGFCSLILLAQPASARRFRIFGIPSFGSSETIDLVYDLPDRAPFIKDGNNLDVGYLKGRSTSGYVIYSGDKYRLLGSEELRVLKDILGFDPTAKHRVAFQAEHGAEIAEAAAEAKAERAHKDKLIASGRTIERAPGESSADYKARTLAFIKSHRKKATSVKVGGPPETESSAGSDSTRFLPNSGMTFLLLLILFMGWANRRKLVSAFSGIFSALSSDSGSDERRINSDIDGSSFEKRVARQLDMMRANVGETGNRNQARDNYAPAEPAPVSRGFGRKIT
jgi:hypothetical protein